MTGQEAAVAADPFAAVLLDFARLAGAGCTREDLLHALCEGATRVLPVDGAGVVSLERGSAQVAVASSEHVFDLERTEVRLRRGPSLDVRRRNDVVRVADLDEDRTAQEWGGYRDAMGAAGLRSVTALPVHAHGMLVGSLELYGRSAEPLSEQALLTARTLVQLAASYLTILDGLEAARRAEEHIAQGVLYDPLTGLPTHALLLDRLRHATACARRRGRAVVVLALHLVPAEGEDAVPDLGDELVVEITKRLTGTLRAEDTLARDEVVDFVVICNDIPAGGVESHADAATSRVRRAFARPFVVDSSAATLDVRVGTAWSQGESDAEQLLRTARLDVGSAPVVGRGV